MRDFMIDRVGRTVMKCLGFLERLTEEDLHKECMSLLWTVERTETRLFEIDGRSQKT